MRLLCCYATYSGSTGTTTITAEHHPRDKHGSMKYSLHVEGGQCHGTVIHCSTERSVTGLFNDVVALHKRGIRHPYLL